MKKWTIGKRIAADFAVMLLITTLIGGFAYSRLFLIQKNATSLTTDSLPAVIILGDIRAKSFERYTLIEKHILSTDDAEIVATEQTLLETSAEISRRLKDYEPTIHTTEDRVLYETDLATREVYRKGLEEVLVLSRANKKQEAFALLKSTVDTSFKKYNDAIKAHVEWNTQNGLHFGDHITNDIDHSKKFILTGILAAIFVASGIGFVTTRTVNRHLRTTSDALESGADQVTAAAGQVSASSQSLAEGASEQAASLEETSASLEELSSMTKRNAESAQEAKVLSNQTRAAAEIGAVDMEAMKTAMDDIKSSSNDIAKIIKSIDEIAFQTNILALNAAVEAARAGEVGMGFAVVAEEVRNLAQRSAQSAKETAAKIEVAISKSEHGVRISSKVALSLGEILEKARQVDTLVAEIATASGEQNQGLSQLNTAVGQMDKVTQANASNAEETADAAKELNAQSQVMRENVAELTKLIGSRQSAGATVSKAPASVTARTDKKMPAPKPAAKAAKTFAPLKSHRQDFHAVEPGVIGHGVDSFRDV